MKLYHRTSHGQPIVNEGFIDGEGTYMTTTRHRGVFLADSPLDINEGAKGRDLLEVAIPIEVVSEYEWIEQEKPYREFCVPAAVVNRYPRRLLLEEEEHEIAAQAHRWAARGLQVQGIDIPPLDKEWPVVEARERQE
jgi:hypothetical protein